MSERARIGTPITTNQACTAILRMIRSPIMGDVDLDRDAGSTLTRLHRVDPEVGSSPYESLSSGEQRLANMAQQIWQARDEGVAVLGGLDRDTRRIVLMVLFYLYLGRDDAPIDLTRDAFEELFRGA